jgi:heptosyltransferase-2
MKIAVFWPNWIGDAVMATPAVRALHSQYSEAEWINVLRPYISGVLEGAPWQERQVFLDTKGPWRNRWPSVAAALRREQIHTAVLFPNSFRVAWVAWLANCRRRIGYRRYGRDVFLTDPLSVARDPSGKRTPSPVVLDYNRLAEVAGCTVQSTQPTLFTTREDEDRADAIWAKLGLNDYQEVVCLNPGAAFGSAKFWPLEHFAALARGFVDERGCGVLVLCGPSEQPMARAIVRLAARRPISSLADAPLSLGLTKACVRRCDLLVTTDSGPRHFAAAFDRPVITLFGPTHIKWTETYHPKAVHLQKQVPCGPCQLRVCPLDHRCMNLLTPAEVLTRARELLGNGSTEPRDAWMRPAG